MQPENTTVETAKVNIDDDQLISKIIVYLEEVERRYQISKLKATNPQEAESA